MKKAYKNYTNNSNMVQTLIDANGNPKAVEIGETVSVLTIAGTSTPAEDRAHKALVKKLAKTRK